MRDCPGAGPDDPEQRDGGLVGPGRSTGAYQTAGQEDPQKERLPSGQAGEGYGDGAGAGGDIVRGVGGVRSNREAEKTQKGNPHNLTCRQHILPRKSIERFADKDGLVSVLFLKGSKSGKSERLPSKNDLFCAKRAWDQRSEVITKKVYEDPFQELAERIVSGETQSLGPKDNITATAFWGLWRARFLADSRNPPEYKTVIGCTGIESKDLRESIEKNLGLFINPESTIPGRAITGQTIQKSIDCILMELGNLEWVIAETKESEFIVSDHPYIFYIPISPKKCLIPFTPSILQTQNLKRKVYLGRERVVAMNKSQVEVSDTYVFSRSIDILRDEIWRA